LYSVESFEQLENKLKNIKGLSFYHSIRGNLLFSSILVLSFALLAYFEFFQRIGLDRFYQSIQVITVSVATIFGSSPLFAVNESGMFQGGNTPLHCTRLYAYRGSNAGF